MSWCGTDDLSSDRVRPAYITVIIDLKRWKVQASPDCRTLTVLSSGSYSDYRIHCGFDNPADAERAAAELNGDSRFPDYHTETLPVMPDGRLPRRVIRYRMGVTVYHHVEHGHEPVVQDNEVWEWQAPPAVRQLPMRGHGEGQEFEGTDKDLVVQAATAYLTELRQAARR